MESPHSAEFFGRMHDPTAASLVKGLCGDEMEFIRSRECETNSGRHCAIPAVTKFYRAIPDYLLMP